MSSAPASHPFTCNSCQVAFKSSELQRTHMQSDWHRYNLKRRVSSLPPLSSEIFAEKVLANKADAAATAARASFERACDACRKTYYSENAFNNHLLSSKHKSNVLRLSRPSKAKGDAEVGSVMSSTFSLGAARTEDESIDEEAEEEFEKVVNGMKSANLKDNEEDPVSRRPTRPHHSSTGEKRREHPLSPANGKVSDEKDKNEPEDAKSISLRECLFCNHYAEKLDDNVTHMTKIHGLFIPERQYLVDLEGLILYLNQKVYEEYKCLYCNRTKYTEDGIKQHMQDLGHCKIAYDSDRDQVEIGEYYDFRSTYSDGERDEDEDEDIDMVDSGATKPRTRHNLKTKATNDDDEMDTDDDEAGWETATTASSVPTEELGAMYEDDEPSARYSRLSSHRHHAHSQRSRHRAADGWHSHAHNTVQAVYHDEFELHLPSGRIAGHRSNNRYFRQNLHNYPTAPEELEKRHLRLRAISDGTSRQVVSRADGGLGMIAASDAKKRQVRAMEKKERKREGRVMARLQRQVDRKGNFQKHYRDPLLQ